MTSTTDPLGNITTTTYDPASNVATRTDANGKTTTFTYDVLNRLTAITYAATTTPPATFAYDANGNRTAMTDGAGTESFAYDSLNRLTSDTRAADTFAYTFDVAGNLLTRTYPDGTVTTHAYDDDGRMVSAASGGSTTTYTYDVAGNLLSTATPDGFVARNTFDRAGRLVEVANVGAAGVLSRFTYALDPVGNRLKMTTTRGTMAYTYDSLDRLTRVDYGGATGSGGGATQSVTANLVGLDCLECGGGGAVPNSPPENNPPAPSDTFTAWTYDPVGNRLTERTYQGTTTYAYDAADRLVSTTAPGTVATSFTYDANGNQTSAGATTYAYDLADRLASASVGTTTETYTWTGDGIRRSAATGPQATKTTQFVVDRTLGAGNVVAERTGSGTLVRRYTYGLDLLAQTTSNKGPYWYHHDGLGSVTDITSATGASLAWTTYTPFGTIRASAATSQAPVNPFRFSGEYLDGSTALYHLRARQYDPGTGRFTSPDPLKAGIGDPVIGAYVYVANNPVRFIDPSGRCIPAIVAGAEVGAALGFVAPGPGNAAGAAGGASVGFALCLGAIAVTFLASFVPWPLTPTGTLQEPPFVNVGPPLPPQPNRPPFRCTTKGQMIVCVTLAGLTYVYYNTANQNSVPTPQPGPPPDVPSAIPSRSPKPRGSRK